jgi:hypothetical protein
MLVIFVALSLFLSRCCAVFCLLYLCISQAFAVPSANLELCDFLSAASVGGLIPRSRSCVMHSIITTLEIVIWYGAVIVLGVRQSGENSSQ